MRLTRSQLAVVAAVAVLLTGIIHYWPSFWIWLDVNHKAVGALFTIIFGLSGMMVAWAAFNVTYRNNFGWQPILLLLENHTKRTLTGEAVIYVRFEVWNMQKYPITIRRRRITFGDGLELGAVMAGGDSDWNTNRSNASSRSNMTIAAQTHQDCRVECLYSGWPERGADGSIMTLVVHYYDPKRGRTVRLQRSTGMWHFQ